MNWDEYEKSTGNKRPPWIDGVGNVNWQFNKKDPPKPPPPSQRPEYTAQRLQPPPPQMMSQNLMVQPGSMPRYQPGLRGWRAGWT